MSSEVGRSTANGGELSVEQSKVVLDPQEAGAQKALWEARLALEAELASLLSKSQGKADRDLVQKWWFLLSQIFSDAAITPGLTVPGDILIRMKRMSQEIAYGRMPEVIKSAVKPGNLPSLQERRDRAVAVAYKLAVEAGLIDDPSPTQTVADTFGLADTRPVTKWVADKRLRSEFLEVFKYSRKMLMEQFAEAGERYMQLGRTHGAIAARAKT